MSSTLPKIVIGLSGGVDSAVSAWLLKKQGFDVIGVTMQIWQDEDLCSLEEKGGCCGVSAVEDARKAAEILEIPYYVMNFKKEFHENVIQYFIQEYQQGRTPNPCIACNRFVKWEAFLRKALQLGADGVATGHYARIKKHPLTGRLTLQAAADSGKDQTYALYNLSQVQLQKTWMPAGDYTKEEMRKIAAEIGLNVAHKPDSQEICFVPDQDYAGFIQRETGCVPVPGEYVDSAGNPLGTHKGIIHYTIGQRKGLGIAFGRPMYVLRIDREKNQVILGSDEELFTRRFLVGQMNDMGIQMAHTAVRAEGKIRYSHRAAPCTIYPIEEGSAWVEFDEPQRAVTPGQAAVFYENGYVLTGGVIEETAPVEVSS